MKTVHLAVRVIHTTMGSDRPREHRADIGPGPFLDTCIYLDIPDDENLDALSNEAKRHVDAALLEWAKAREFVADR